MRAGIDRLEQARELPTGLTLVSAALAAAVLSPVLWLVLRAMDVGTEKAIDLLTHASSIEILLNSLGLVVAVTAGSVALGVSLAVLTVRTDLPFSRFFTVALALPLVIPSYIGAFAYVSAFGPRGRLTDLLSAVGIESIPSIYGFEGAVLVLTLYIYPYVFITTRAALLSFDSRLVAAARTLNQDRWTAFWRITLPRIVPGIVAGALLVALYTLSDFGTPTIMHTEVLTQAIFVEYNSFGRDTAALLSVQLLVVTTLILGLESLISNGDRTAYVSRGIGESGEITLGGWAIPAVGFCVVVILFTLVVPVGVFVFWLLRGGAGYEFAPAFELSYAFNSVFVSVLAACAVVAAIPIAYLSARSDSWLPTLFDRSTYVGYAVPGVVLGLALIYFATMYAPMLYQTLGLLIFAYVVRFLPQAVGTTRSSVLQVDPTMGEAARTLGADGMGSFVRVTLPLIAPGVVAGGALVFLTTMKELPATLLLRPAEFETIVSYIWRMKDGGYYGKAALPTLVLVVVSGLSMVVLLALESDNTNNTSDKNNTNYDG